MIPIGRDELVILRHAPADHGGRLCGRTDVGACLPEAPVCTALRQFLTGTAVITSPARRCRETAEAIFGCPRPDTDDRLWEQDFGTSEGKPFAELPDLGPLPLGELAQYSAEGGESFLDMTARVTPALLAYGQQARTTGPVLLVAHAGTARAALGLALGQPEFGLKFEIAPLSLTRLRCLEDGFSIIGTNQRDGA